MKKPQISLIIPVYNAEKTLRRCLESVAAQTQPGLQVLLVDDGSRDGSAAICAEFAARDSRFQLLRQENAGVSAARNHGITAAEGEYLMFADADDYLPPDAAEQFLRAAEDSGADLVISDFYRVSGELVEQKGDIREEGTIDQRAFARYMMEKPSDFYYGVMWNKLYRRALVTEYAMELDCRVKWCEDLLFNLQFLGHVKTVCVLRKPLYYYVNNANSLAKQNATLGNWVRMKRMVYEQYKALFEDLGMYERPSDILKVSRFFMTVATDGVVLPKPNELLRHIAPAEKPSLAARKRKHTEADGGKPARKQAGQLRKKKERAYEGSDPVL